MSYMTKREVMRSCIDERDEALDTIDDMIDTIAKGIISIAHQNDDFVCTCCLGTAHKLFGLMKKYAREEDTERIRAEWKHITGRDIE
jgi:hypothetical protein